MPIAIFDIPIQIVVLMNGEKKDGYALYVESGGFSNNDCWCVALEDGGQIIHVLSDQILLHSNETYRIKKKKE